MHYKISTILHPFGKNAEGRAGGVGGKVPVELVMEMSIEVAMEV